MCLAPALAVATLLPAGYCSAQIAQRININPAVSSNDVDEFAISPDGTMIAFVGSLEGDATDQAYVIPFAGGDAVRLSPDGAGDVDGGLAWMPDNSGIAVRYDSGFGNIGNNIYLLPVDGSQIASQLTFSATNDFDPQITADGSTLIFSDNHEDEDFNGDDLTYAAPIATPGAATLLTPDDITEIDTGGFAQVGSDLVFAGSLPGEGETRFYRTPLDGSGIPSEITVTDLPDFTDIDEMMVTPDGQTILFVADITTDGVDSLYSMPIGGGPATRLLPNIEGFTDVNPFAISPDGSLIAFSADYETNGINEAYVLPITGGDPIKVSQPSPRADFDVLGGVDRLAFSPDGQSVVYISDLTANGLNELFIAPVNPIPEPAAILIGGLAIVLAGARRRPATN